MPATMLLLFLALSQQIGTSLADLTINQLQVVGTHNSYHLAPDEGIIQLLASELVQPLFKAEGTNLPTAWSGNMPTLKKQLDAGVRQLEIDVYSDSEGGAFQYAAGLKFIGKDGALSDEDLKKPGYKVLHVPDLDYNSTCTTFTQCMEEIKEWSYSNPGHFPLYVFLEAKETNDLDLFLRGTLRTTVEATLKAMPAPPTGLTTVVPMNVTDLMTLESEILSIFELSDIVTPDDVRGDAVSLADALLGKDGSAWPSVNATLGKVFFVLIAAEGIGLDYIAQYPNLASALFWVMGKGGVEQSFPPEIVFTEIAVDQLDSKTASVPANATAIVDELAEEVRAAVEQGFMVRSRSDYDLIEAAADFVYRRDKLIEAGAHFIMTDVSPPTTWSGGYKVYLPNAPSAIAAQCNPVTTGSTSYEVYCSDQDLASFAG